MARKTPKKRGATKFAAGKADDFSAELWHLLDQAGAVDAMYRNREQ
jgi:hypothetical protein